MLSLPLEIIDHIAIFCLQNDLLDEFDHVKNSMKRLYKALGFTHQYYHKRLSYYLQSFEKFYFTNENFVNFIYQTFCHDLYYLEICKSPTPRISILLHNLYKLSNVSNTNFPKHISFRNLWSLVSHKFSEKSSFKQIQTCELLKYKIGKSRQFMIEADWLELIETCYPVCMSYSKAINLLTLF